MDVQFAGRPSPGTSSGDLILGRPRLILGRRGRLGLSWLWFQALILSKGLRRSPILGLGPDLSWVWV
jgi:hypothetical protein